ncbi:MAG: hypothetical protein IPI99_01335 [Saprospiraceae bacterium]|nr:hypothetical protein [Saprospiraceae bacterium]
MSFVISITKNVISSDDDIAWKQNWEMYERYHDDKNTPDPILQKFLEEMLQEYPMQKSRLDSIEDEEVFDDDIWLDDPTTSVHSEMSVLGISSGYVEEVMPQLVKTANKYNLVVFDDQEGIIYRPNKKSEPLNKKKWYQFF